MFWPAWRLLAWLPCYTRNGLKSWNLTRSLSLHGKKPLKKKLAVSAPEAQQIDAYLRIMQQSFQNITAALHTLDGGNPEMAEKLRKALCTVLGSLIEQVKWKCRPKQRRAGHLPRSVSIKLYYYHCGRLGCGLCGNCGLGVYGWFHHLWHGGPHQKNGKHPPI